MVWNKDYECMPVEELQKFQLEKLKETVNWISEKVPFYQKKLKEMNITADDLKSIEDSAKLPFTVKNDLRDNYPFDLCAVPMKDIVRVHASSGTTGKPITGPYTKDDMEQWIECMCRNLYSAGVRESFKTSCDIHTVTIDAVLLFDHIPKVDPYPKLHSAVFG